MIINPSVSTLLSKSLPELPTMSREKMLLPSLDELARGQKMKHWNETPEYSLPILPASFSTCGACVPSLDREPLIPTWGSLSFLGDEALPFVFNSFDDDEDDDLDEVPDEDDEDIYKEVETYEDFDDDFDEDFEDEFDEDYEDIDKIDEEEIEQEIGDEPAIPTEEEFGDIGGKITFIPDGAELGLSEEILIVEDDIEEVDGDFVDFEDEDEEFSDF
ncbi:MAG: hypothetical protein Q4D38_14190 [Planctomycetia bacterium]|nr:hypothetical protein [Planctomycetia bacterium]